MNIKEVWNVWRESTPADKDMQRAFERACTPRACHGVLIELESANQKVAELEKALDKLIDRAQQVDSWESFPESWIDEAYAVLKESKYNEQPRDYK
jgi:hypothetical protein